MESNDEFDVEKKLKTYTTGFKLFFSEFIKNLNTSILRSITSLEVTAAANTYFEIVCTYYNYNVWKKLCLHVPEHLPPLFFRENAA